MDSLLQPGERLDEVNFRLRLMQKTSGLLFGTDALLLASYIKPSPRACAAELGGGSGIVSLLCLAREKVKHVTCIEVQPSYADLIERNTLLNRFGDRMTVKCCDVRDVAQQGEERGQYDIVFSNPPYMKTTAGAPNKQTEKNIARHEIMGDIDDFCAAAARLLRYGGCFYCVYRCDRMADLFSALQKNKLEPKRLTMVHANAKSAPSMFLLCATYGGKPGLHVTRPLLLYQAEVAADAQYTEDMQQVMACGSMPQAIE